MYTCINYIYFNVVEPEVVLVNINVGDMLLLLNVFTMGRVDAINVFSILIGFVCDYYSV